MKEKKNIDRIFQESFKDFEREPNKDNWAKIAERLDDKEKKRPFIIPLWFKLGGVAAILAIILTSIIFTTNLPIDSNEPEVVFEKSEDIQKNNPNSDISGSSSDRISNSDSEQSNEKNRNFTNGPVPANATNEESLESLTNSSKANIASGTNSLEAKKSSVTSNTKLEESSKNRLVHQDIQNPKVKKQETGLIRPDTLENGNPSQIAEHSSEKSAIENGAEELKGEITNALVDIEQKQKANETDKTLAETSKKKLRLSTFAAPVFYNNVGSGNELSNQFANNSTSSDVTFSYGVKVAYTLSDKVKIRTGVSKINVNQNIQDISYSPAAAAIGLENLSPTGENIRIRTTSNPSAFENDGMSMSSIMSSVYTPGEIRQQFGFIEIPLEVEFALIDNQFGLHLIGGGSTLILNENQVDLVAGNENTRLGEASNINTTSFSTNIGLGMEYNLNDKFSISLEPIFKYQLNTFENVNDVKPTNFGVYSGINLKF